MKTVIILSGTAVALVLIALLTGFLGAAALVTCCLLLLALILLILSVCFSVKQARVMNHLIAEGRKRKREKAVAWKDEDAQELNLIQKRIELFVLQNQINPHFLYNTLDSIRSRAMMDGQAEIACMTEILSRFFRYCISNNDNLVKVREELSHIQDYYYIQKYRFEDRFEMEVEVEQEDIYELYLPKMTLQPLVENAMIHGLEKSEQKGRIQIRLMRTDKQLIIIISDNGVGISRENLIRLNERMEQHFMKTGRGKDRHNGIALSNVNMRLKITFGEENGIHYRSMEGEGTDAVITMPVVDVFFRVKYENQFER